MTVWLNSLILLLLGQACCLLAAGIDVRRMCRVPAVAPHRGARGEPGLTGCGKSCDERLAGQWPQAGPAIEFGNTLPCSLEGRYL